MAQIPKRRYEPDITGRIFHTINGGIFVAAFVASASLIQPRWLNAQPGWTLPSAVLGFIGGSIGSAILYKPLKDEDAG